jgi:serine/threonine protein kinase
MNCTSCGGLLDVSGMELATSILCPLCGQEISVTWNMGAYALKRRLGAGGMGVIYEADDRTLGRTVAVKVLSSDLAKDQDFIQNFAREAKITASISHPNVVQVYSFGRDRESYYLAMELIQLGSLDDYMQKIGALGEVEMLDVGIGAARGLQAAYERGLLHRDVKPGNILFGPNRVPKVVDFGLAVTVEEARKGGGEIWGTPYYVAPEKLEQLGEDARSDIYSLGAALFHAIAGRPPFEAPTASLVAWKHLKAEKVALKAFAPYIADETAYVIGKCCERYPENRFQSYDELIENFEFAKKRALAKARTPKKTRSEDLLGGQQENTATLIIVGAGAIVAAILLLLFAFKDKLFHVNDPFEDVRTTPPAHQILPC